MKKHISEKHEAKEGGGLVGFLQNVDNTNLTHLVYNLHTDLYVNLHLQEYMKIYNLLSHF